MDTFEVNGTHPASRRWHTTLLPKIKDIQKPSINPLNRVEGLVSPHIIMGWHIFDA
ncbi:MAG: hypothetical protein QXT55_01835 [Desulfurococcus sp.]|jgi:hypothetical protein